MEAAADGRFTARLLTGAERFLHQISAQQSDCWQTQKYLDFVKACRAALPVRAIGRIKGRTKDTVKVSLDCVGECKQKGSASFLYTFRMFHGIMDAEYGLPKV